jgi:hypothetical protein
MTPAKNLPEPVQWLLDFANIGCISGEPNPQRFKSYYTYTFREYTTNEHIPKLKRPPIELLPPAKEKDTFYKLPADEQKKRFKEEIENMKPGETISHSMPLHALIRIWKERGFTNNIRLDDGYEISISKTGEPVPHGKNIELFPLIVDFCSKRVILLEKNFNHVSLHKKCNYSMAMTYWHIAQSFFNRVIQENNREDVHPFCEKAFDYAKKNKPGHELLKRVNDSVWDFWNNHRSLHSRLRQCLCCGAFFLLREMQKGRRPVYCGRECKAAFNLVSCEKDSTTKKNNREQKRKTAAVGIIKWLRDAGLSKHKAEEIYNDRERTSPKTVASLKEFKRTYGEKHGIKNQ